MTDKIYTRAKAIGNCHHREIREPKQVGGWLKNRKRQELHSKKSSAIEKLKSCCIWIPSSGYKWKHTDKQTSMFKGRISYICSKHQDILFFHVLLYTKCPCKEIWFLRGSASSQFSTESRKYEPLLSQTENISILTMQRSRRTKL